MGGQTFTALLWAIRTLLKLPCNDCNIDYHGNIIMTKSSMVIPYDCNQVSILTTTVKSVYRYWSNDNDILSTCESLYQLLKHSIKNHILLSQTRNIIQTIMYSFFYRHVVISFLLNFSDICFYPDSWKIHWTLFWSKTASDAVLLDSWQYFKDKETSISCCFPLHTLAVHLFSSHVFPHVSLQIVQVF